MRFLLHLAAAALLLAIGIGGMTSATAADRDVRASVLGRQKIREELSAALAKGHLTRMDQYHILLHAKEVLSEDDLHGLEQTLDRIAKQQAAGRAAKKAEQNETPLEQDADDSKPGTITPSKYEEIQGVEVPASGEPALKKAKASSDEPYIEEVPAPAGIGQPSIHIDSDDPEGSEYDPDDWHARFRWINVDVFSSIDAFKGPLDLADGNGNFGMRLGANAAVPVLPDLGVALQAGTSVILSDFKGSNYPSQNATSRDQIFTTVGIFQRITREDGALTWGFAYDWLFDDYYANFHFGQWRVKGAWEVSPWNEFGIQASLPEHGSSATITDFFGNVDILGFKPIAQGFLYWKHTWTNDASLTGRLGVAERPGEFVFGAAGRMPLTQHVALTSDFSYIMPMASGGPNLSLEGSGQAQEIWNVSIGIEFVLGGFGHGDGPRFQPFLPVADNGSFAVHENSEYLVP